MKNIWNKLKQNRFSIAQISTLVFVFFVFVVKSVHAATNPLVSFAIGSMLAIIGEIGVYVLDMVSFFLSLAQFLFQIALLYNLRFGNKLEIIKIGWDISRDVANIFFIVVLLVIAIATILRIGSYAAKQLLPSLIIMAILINFSLTIGLVVVDVSNTLGLQFYNAITDDNTRTVSSLIMTGTGMQHVFNFKDSSASATTNFAAGIIQTGVETVTTFVPPKLMEGIGKGNLMPFAITAWGNAIFMSVLVFTFFVATIILLVRVAVISTLLMLAPIAFLFYILPDTKTHWNKWWSALIQHCFFLPAFLFLLYFAIVFIIKVGLANSGTTGNFVDNPGLIFAYILAIILLMQALILGRSMGVMGASTAISWAQRGRKMATGFIAGQTVGRVSERMLSNEKVKAFVEQRSPWLGRRIQGVIEKGAATGGRQKSAEATAAFVSRLSPEDQAKKWEQMSFAEKQALLRKSSAKQREDLIKNLSNDEQKNLARRILGTSLAADQKADLDAAEYQKLPENTKTEKDAKDREFSNLSREAKERVLHTMSKDQQADLATRLRDPANKIPSGGKIADELEDIINKEFTPAENDAYVVARENKKTFEERVKGFIDPKITDRQRAAILLSMDPNARRKFIEEVNGTQMGHPLPGTQLVDPKQIMRDYFTPEKLMEHEATTIDAEKNPDKRAKLYSDVTDEKLKEFYATKHLKDAGARASLISKIEDDDKREDALKMLKRTLTPREYAEVEAAMLIKNYDKQDDTKLQKAFDDTNTRTDELGIEEALKSLKTDEDRWDFIHKLNERQQKDLMKEDGIWDRTLSRAEKESYEDYEWREKSDDDKRAESVNDAGTDIQKKAIARKLRSITGNGRVKIIMAMEDKNVKIKGFIDNNMTKDEIAKIEAEKCSYKEMKKKEKGQTQQYKSRLDPTQFVT